MAHVTPTQVSPGDEISAASVNTPVNQIAAQINGNLDDTNISGISGSKLAAGTVPESAMANPRAYKVGLISPSATGSLATTGVGFTPKKVSFTLVSVTSSTVNYGGFGVTDGTNQYATSFYNEQGVDNSGSSASDKCIQAITTNGTVVVDGAFTSFDADGFTLNITTRSAARSFIYEAEA